MATETGVELNIPKIIGQLLVITIIPVSIGMLIKAKGPRFAEIMDKPVKVASGVVLALVIIGLVIKEKANVASYFEQAGIIALTLNILTMALGYFSAKLFSLPRKQAISISIESGIQNGTLAIAIATVSLGQTSLAIAAAIYSLIMFFTGFTVIALGVRNKEMETNEA
jgi:BASS family bile acid:Na+ symporter